MHYVALVHRGKEASEREVEIQEVAPGKYSVTMGGRTYELDAQHVSDSTLSFIVDHHAYNVEFEENKKGGQNLLVRGNVLHVEVLDLRKMSVRKARTTVAGLAGPVTIGSPMPGKVVTVLVKEGQTVAEGQGLVVVEAMKMENELKAPKAGVVKSLTAVVGSAVEGGTALCVIE